MAYAGSAGVYRGTPFEFKAAAAETASTTHSVHRAADNGPLAVTVTVTAASGTTPTLVLFVEGSNDGTTWFTLGKIGSDGYSVGSVASTPANITGAVTVNAVFPLTEFVRTRSVVGGTTPSFTYSVQGSVA